MAPIVSRWLRFDARSLGLGRIVLGLALVFDLLHRWDWIEEFYSNEGVLPNHNHLFQLGEQGQAWSIYHSFSSVDENQVAFLVTFFIYASFTLGWHTRVFHALSVACLVSLSGRNVLVESIGNSVGIAILMVTLFLPLGLRFSVDSLRWSLADFDEHDADALNDRTRPALPDAPLSLAPLCTLGVLGLIYLGGALQQTGPGWQDGTALYYALHVDRLTSGLGVAVREQAGLLGPWTKAFRYCQLAVLPLALVPVARRVTRGMAVAAMLLHGLTIGLLFTYGLYGWSLCAAALMLIPEESWDAMKRRTRPITLIYDDDCGICLWCTRLLKRLDLRENVTFRPNSDVDALPGDITPEIANESMIAVDAAGKPHRDAMALYQAIRSLPLVGWLGLLILVPGIEQLTRYLYNRVARNRIAISVAFGLGACGVPLPGAEAAPGEDQLRTRATRIGVALRTLVATGGSLVVLLCIWAQTERQNTLPYETGLGQRQRLVTAASWARVLAPWGLWAPDAPRDNAGLVTSATTRNEQTIDVLTGHPPDHKLENPRLARRGVLWAAYTEAISNDGNDAFRPEFRRYLTKGGYAIDTREPGNYIRNLEVHWVSVPIPAPGEPPSGEPQRIELFNQQGRTVGPKRPKLPFPRVDDR